MHLNGARRDTKPARDFFAGQPFRHHFGHLPLATCHPCDGAMFRDIREAPDRTGEGGFHVKRLPSNATPEMCAIPAAHDAFILVTPAALHLVQTEVADALVFLHRGIQRRKRVPVEIAVPVAEHLGKPSVASADHTVFGIDQPNGGVIECESIKIVFHGNIRICTDQIIARAQIDFNGSKGGDNGR